MMGHNEESFVCLNVDESLLGPNNTGRYGSMLLNINEIFMELDRSMIFYLLRLWRYSTW
jgi:hypothetical protein